MDAPSASPAADGDAATRWIEGAHVLWLGLVPSLLFAGVFAATRNVYDDEVGGFRWMLLPLAELWQQANAQDVHPPGQYALGRLFLQLTGSVRGMALGPVLFLYTGIAVFVSALLRGARLRGSARVVFVLLAFLHPNVMMWGTTSRWQSWWTGLALVALTLGLALDRRARGGDIALPSVGRMVAVGCLLGASLYVNYLGFVLVALLALGWLVRHEVSGRSLVRLAIAPVVALLLFAPQLDPLVAVHLPDDGAQFTSPLSAAARMLAYAVVGQTMLPWHPVAPLFGLATLPFLLALIPRGVRHTRERGGLVAALRGVNPAWLALGVLYLAAFAVAITTGLGRKPRSFLFLSPILAFLIATGWQWTSRRGVRAACAAVFALGVVTSGYHLLAKVGVGKSGFNDRYDEVIAVLREESAGRSTLLFSHDPALAFAIHAAARNERERWVVCGVVEDAYHGEPCRALLAAETPIETMVVVESYIGSLFSRREHVFAAANAALDRMNVRRRVRASFDRDAAMKRRLPLRAAALVPDHRFVLYLGDPKPGANPAALAGLYLAAATAIPARGG